MKKITFIIFNYIIFNSLNAQSKILFPKNSIEYKISSLNKNFIIDTIFNLDSLINYELIFQDSFKLGLSNLFEQCNYFVKNKYNGSAVLFYVENIVLKEIKYTQHYEIKLDVLSKFKDKYDFDIGFEVICVVKSNN